MRITLRQLEIFRAICREGSITAAASQIGLSQAAASQALAELENLLERKLFERLGKKVLLNSEGKQLLPAAVEILDRISEIEGSAYEPARSLNLGASLTVGSYMLPAFLARFSRQYPRYDLRLKIENTEQIVSDLLQFEFDAAWVEGYVQHPDLKDEWWADDELVIIAPPSHPLAGRETALKNLSAETWILREKGSGTREVFERAVQGRLRMDRVIELSGIEAVKHTVLAGGGIACVSSAAVADELKSRKLSKIRVPGLNLQRQITLLIHKHKYIDKALGFFLQSARDRKS